MLCEFFLFYLIVKFKLIGFNVVWLRLSVFEREWIMFYVVIYCYLLFLMRKEF